MKKSRFATMILGISVLTLVFATIFMGTNAPTTSAKEVNPNVNIFLNSAVENLNPDDVKQTLKTIKESIILKNGEYSFDESKAIKLGLEKDVIDNVKNLESNVLEQFYNLKDSEIETGSEQLQGDFSVLKEKDPLARVLYLSLVAFIGLNFANNVLNDIYRLGAIGWCRSTTHSLAISVCITLGYR
ncbi:hypothetical protein ACT3UT_14255 [Bacillus spizizenii ATCC 6633 = JCM 2499]|uniref:Uncharacterized protein n=2 Tax=Bacillus spizizenii TaxID=96241 RepID=E0TX39_BACSH|nr:hypothetical protein [Bacillus spizizenii]QCJ17138.1 hypothetical protein FA024_08260 [Bacillus subtilis]ADM37945.1 hypothetical protein BSUW23_09495 [Bacillus spizizenii str. W23]AJW87280.1 hypothetical protein BIS30_20090 [Bacillus spizizenii]EFG93086.1 hypothetical protein BSU6633_05514 [Bacillus spizizenii ATCC 6633 = JCM 2499]KFK80609.1 hypothetical protein DJ97_2808 [Bacillus spizizenii]